MGLPVQGLFRSNGLVFVDNIILLFLLSVVVSGLCYSLCELVSSEEEQSSTLDLLLQEIKAKDVVSFLFIVSETYSII